MYGYRAQDGLDERKILDAIHQLGFPRGKATGRAINKGLELCGRRTSQRKRGAEVGEEHLDHGAPKCLDNRHRCLGITVQQRRRALRVVDSKARRALRDLKYTLDGRDVARRWVGK